MPKPFPHGVVFLFLLLDVNVSAAEEFPTAAGLPVCQSGCASSEHLAHRAAAMAYAGLAIDEHREYAWNVCRVADGSYAFTRAMRGARGAESVRTPPAAAGCEPLSSGHVHWSENEWFSGQDWLWVASNRRPLYLVNPSGELRRLDVVRVLSMRRNGRSALPRPREQYAGRLLDFTLPIGPE